MAEVLSGGHAPQTKHLNTQTGDFYFGDFGEYSSGTHTEFENWRGRAHLGLNYDMGPGGPTMNVGAFYDGIGTDYESYGANVCLDWKF